MQKVLIIEDDYFSARRLKRLIMDIDDTINVHGPLKSVTEVTEELAANNDYDLEVDVKTICFIYFSCSYQFKP